VCYKTYGSLSDFVDCFQFVALNVKFQQVVMCDRYDCLPYALLEHDASHWNFYFRCEWHMVPNYRNYNKHRDWFENILAGWSNRSILSVEHSCGNEFDITIERLLIVIQAGSNCSRAFVVLLRPYKFTSYRRVPGWYNTIGHSHIFFCQFIQFMTISQS
jgi:hypothetical protein